MKSPLTATLALALAVLAPRVAGAQDDAARVHFESGRLHYESGDYEEALREFRAAYERSPRPVLLFNLFNAAERLGRYQEAADYLERYLAEEELEPTRAALLQRRLDNARARASRQVEAGAQIQPGAQATANASPAGGGGDLVPAAISFAVAGAAFVSFGVFAGLAVAEDERLAGGCGATQSCTTAQVSDLSTFNLVADISWISGAVAATAGLILLLTLGLDAGAPAEESARLVPLLSPQMVGAAAEGSF